ncbi:MAG: SpoIID/LytB domain-containing protein [Clostridiaceae bacterium]|jgi:stage II sporulation protein D|nr:SpoIID/LytB domain-containing protein [Clostridiaceae bacterium]
MKKILLLNLFIFALLSFQNPCYAIKIGLKTGAQSLVTGTSVKSSIIDANTNHKICDIDKMTAYELRPYHSIMAIKIKGNYYKINSDNIAIRFFNGATGYTSIKNKWYRGVIKVQNKGGSLTAINDIPLEDYIKGVVPSEMPSSWNSEALKAQAIAARSYAMANLGKHGSQGFDLVDTPADQAYGGASAERYSSNQAVNDTKGIVITYGMKIICAYYSASAGGQSVSAADAWGSNLPYIRSVPSYDGEFKKNGHGVGMSQHGANNLANQGYNAFQILQYFYKDVQFARLKDYV